MIEIFTMLTSCKLMVRCGLKYLKSTPELRLDLLSHRTVYNLEKVLKSPKKSFLGNTIKNTNDFQSMLARTSN